MCFLQNVSCSLYMVTSVFFRRTCLSHSRALSLIGTGEEEEEEGRRGGGGRSKRRRAGGVEKVVCVATCTSARGGKWWRRIRRDRGEEEDFLTAMEEGEGAGA
jgi:hypothetical protein